MRHFFVVMELLEGQRWTVFKGFCNKKTTPVIFASFCKQYVLTSSVITVITWLHPHPGIPIPSRSNRQVLISSSTSQATARVFLWDLAVWTNSGGKKHNKLERQLDDAANFGCQVGAIFFEILQSKFWRRWLYVLLFNRPWQQHFFSFLSPKIVKGKG